MRVGISFVPFETRIDVIVRLAARADERGLERVYVAEGWTHDALFVLAEIASRTSQIGVSTGILSAWSRTPATMALGAVALQRSAEGRFMLGIGASSPPLTEGLHGVTWESPAGRLREVVTAVRSLLAGERLPTPAAGARPLRLGVAPDVPVPIELAALSPTAVRLAGELADGWIPFLWPRSRLAEGRALLDEGEARAQAPTPTRSSIMVPVALAADEPAARRLANWWLHTYLTRMGPLYPRMLAERFAMADAVAAVVNADGDGGESDLPASALGLAEDVTLCGTYERAGDLMSTWMQAGADSLTLVLPPGRPEEQLAELIDVVADAVASARPVLAPSSTA